MKLFKKTRSGIPFIPKEIQTIMKIVILTLTLLPFNVHAVPVDNQKKITLDVMDQTIIEVLFKIESQTDYRFIYEIEKVNLEKKVSLRLRNQSIENVLRTLFKDVNVTYTITERNMIVIKPGTAAAPAGDGESASRQDNKVSGIVTDAQGEPIIGASVIEKGTSNGVPTDLDGRFSLTVPGNAVLEVSYIGFFKQEVSVAGRQEIAVRMTEDTKTLDEVVVIGYGSVKKSNVTGAITQVKAEDLPQTANMSLGQMLTGKAAGLQVSLQSAQPGGGVWLQIRGDASGGAGNKGPLYVIDGFPVSTDDTEPGNVSRYKSGSKSPLNNLNPADIESIEILKDASATAIYGARAAHGVVLITTKRGAEGGRPTVQYSGSVSVQKKARHIDMLDGPGFMRETNRVLYEDWLSDNTIYPYGGADLSSASSAFVPRYSDADIAGAQTTNWLENVERDGFITQHNISLTGGTDKNSYYVSGGYYDQKGVIRNNDMQRYSGRFNFDQKLGRYIKTGVNVSVSQVNSNNVALGDGQNENAGVIRAAMNANPTIPIYDEEGNYTLDPDQPYLANAVSLLEISDQSTVTEFLGNFFLTVSPIEGLDIRMNTGIQHNKGERDTYLPKSTLYGDKAGGEASKSYKKNNSKLFDLVASYQKSFDTKHQISAMAGYSYQHFSNSGFSAGNSQFITDAFKWNSLGSGEHTKPSVSSQGGEEVLGSLFTRLTYNFDDRYLISATMRADAASKFAENHKWGYFPSVALAWRMINEKFMQEQEVLSDLKWRVSLGQTGNSNVENNALALYSTGSKYIFGDDIAIGVKQTQLANPNLKWETTTELNVGLDYGFFRNRVTGSMEFFTKKVTDLLDDMVLMQYNPVSTVKSNSGSKGSRGFELGINSRNMTGSFFWSTDFAFSFYRDRWRERNPQWKKAIYESEKDMLKSRYRYLSDGLVQPSDMNPDGTCKIPHMPNAKPGMIKYKDVNGRDENGNLTGEPDGILDDADIVNLGTETSKFYAGLGNNFAWKGFDFSIFFYGYFGRQIENASYDWYLKRSWFLKNGVNMAAAVTDRWAHDNPTGKYPTSIMNPYDRDSDFWLENAAFVRCKNITLGYTLPKMKKLDGILQHLRVYCDVNNPFVITNYSGVDPEMDSMAAYPTQLTISFGVDITF